MRRRHDPSTSACGGFGRQFARKADTAQRQKMLAPVWAGTDRQTPMATRCSATFTRSGYSFFLSFVPQWHANRRKPLRCTTFDPTSAASPTHHLKVNYLKPDCIYSGCKPLWGSRFSISEGDESKTGACLEHSNLQQNFFITCQRN